MAGGGGGWGRNVPKMLKNEFYCQVSHPGGYSGFQVMGMTNGAKSQVPKNP